ncbi:hypothetical protein ACIA8O_10295 [Kitasatospora sp. NPDC051853]|uniref:hypothetical protein n=1 Tax=Kitasatospora sp. NPDC051853 TaxID=3364058 RepID=UPI0037A05326
MDREAVLQESRTMRGGMADRVEALDGVKALVLLPDGVHVTARMVADYYGVGEKAVESLVHRHRAELTEHGYRVLKGSDLLRFVSFNLKESTGAGRGLGIFPRRAVLVVGMLLRGSVVAKAVRRELLELAERAVAGAAEWRYELAELREELAEIRELQLVMLRQSQLDREVIAGLSVRMADCQSAVRTLGGRVDMLCTVLAARGPGERRRRRR